MWLDAVYVGGKCTSYQACDRNANHKQIYSHKIHAQNIQRHLQAKQEV